MTKKSKFVSKYFNKLTKKSKTVWYCKFCDLKYTVKNATKMKIHLIKACKNTPLQVKEELSDKKLPILTAETNIVQRGNFLRFCSVLRTLILWDYLNKTMKNV